MLRGRPLAIGEPYPLLCIAERASRITHRLSYQGQDAVAVAESLGNATLTQSLYARSGAAAAAGQIVPFVKHLRQPHVREASQRQLVIACLA